MVQALLAVLATAAAASAQTKIVLSNDDGWAVANIRAAYNAFTEAGFDVVLSAPAENNSGTSSLDFPPTPVIFGCEFDSCPPLSPAEGSDINNTRLNYVNSFPVTSIKYGIQTLAPQFFVGSPDLGPNVGSNLGISTLASGTVGAASEAAKEGIPSIAFSGASGSQVSYTTLSNTSAASTISAELYASAATFFINALISSTAPLPFLPPGISLNVNFPAVGASGCTSAEDIQYVLTRIYDDPFATDVDTCGSDTLPTESSVVDGSGCLASVSVFNASTKLDSDAATQAVVLQRLSSILVCS